MLIKLLSPFIISLSLFLLWDTNDINTKYNYEDHVFDIVIDHKNKLNLSTNQEPSLAEQLCAVWGGGIETTECKVGKRLEVNFFKRTLEDKVNEIIDSIKEKKITNIKPESIDEIVRESLIFSEDRINELIILRDRFLSIQNRTEGFNNLIVNMSSKINFAEQKIGLVSQSRDDVLTNDEYKHLFVALLSLEGMKYNESSGEFKKISWDISRVFDNSLYPKLSTEINKFIIKFSPIIFFFLALSVSFFVAHNFNIYGNITYLCTSFFVWLGLMLVLDASVNFGKDSASFALNPLGGQINRQFVIFIISYFLIIFGLYSKDIFNKFLSDLGNNPKISIFSAILIVTLSYGFISPAVGSEFLKLILITFSAIVTFRHARESFLAKKYLKQDLNIFKAFSDLINKNHEMHKIGAYQYINLHIFKAYFKLIFVAIITLFFAAIIFGDLGGALISALILIVLAFLIFGIKLAIYGVSFLFLLSLLLLSTNKVQDRVNLMLEPMYASVSDFARLIGFSMNSYPEGYGIGKIEWCSNGGICLPLQSLSDYVPTLIHGAVGSTNANIIFIVFCLFFGFISFRSMYCFLLPNFKYKLLAIFIFYCSTAYLIQTLVTYFGNWRIIPLTGLSVPFISIGFSSMIFPCFIVGMFLALTSYEKFEKKI